MEYYCGIIESGNYIEFRSPRQAISVIENLPMKTMGRLGDVHKVADYGNDLEPGPQREHWISTW